MAKVTQELHVGGIPCARLAYAATFSEGSTTEIATFARFDPGATPTAGDFVAVADISPTFGDSPDKEYADYELRDKNIIRYERTTSYFKAATGDTLANADNPDSIEMIFAFNTAQKLRLQELKSAQTPVILVYPEMNTVSLGTPDGFTYILGTIKSLSQSNDSMAEFTMSIEGTIEYTCAAGLTYDVLNTELGIGATAPVEFAGFGEDADSGVNCTGLTSADDLADLFTGGITTILQTA